ncbi:MAG TPA: PEP-CTERM sorting domain-containing protein [Myxococcota bacterium]|nr:PEP-CTERM sorting domain-containing protein [Myxococcota bacterium]
MPATGDNLFVTNFTSGTIGEYTTSGATVNVSLVTGLSAPAFLAVSGSNLFVANEGAPAPWVSEYTTSGGLVSAPLITFSPNPPVSVAVSGSDLFVVVNGGTIGKYTTSGAPVNPTLITGTALDGPWGIVVVPVPEPATALLVMVGVLGLAVARRRLALTA